MPAGGLDRRQMEERRVPCHGNPTPDAEDKG